MQSHPNSFMLSPGHRALLAALIGLAALNPAVQAAATDISNTPLATTSDITAKPNVMFILDDSGSMGDEHMPDNMDDSSLYGFKSIQCNGVAYDPAYDYTDKRPVGPDGTQYPNVPFDAAPEDGFQMSLSSSKNLIAPIPMGLGDKTFQVSNPGSVTYATGLRVGIVNANNDTQWLVGNVRSWNKPNLVVTITGFAGGGSASGSWRVGPQNISDLGNRSYFKYKGNLPRGSWKYNASGSVDTTSDGGFANECTKKVSSSNPSTVFDTVYTSTLTATQKQNYANWYAYSRKRYLMMRTAVGRAFSPIDSKYRVGFTTINDPSAAPSNTFLEVGAFDSNQKVSFYSDLYRADVNNSTPLRGALSKVGRYFANKAPGQVNDPMEYACQRNYSILSTDGYWNTGSSSVPEGGNFGPLQLDGSTNVGQQDGQEARPMWDGAATVVTTQTPYTLVRHQKTVDTVTTTTVWSRNVYTTTTNGCSGGKSRLNTQPQRGTQTLVEAISSYQDITGSYTRTKVTTDGVLTSDTTTTTTWAAPVTTNVDAQVTTDNTVWLNYGSSANSGTCANPYSLPPTNPSALVKVSGPNMVSASVATTLSTDAAVAGTAGTPVVTTSGGSSNSLADVAQYYYATDLRSSTLSNCTGALGTDVCNNEVPIAGLDRAEHQHMTTFTLGLGMNGILPYSKDYLSNLTSGSYFDLKNGTKKWPIATSSSSGITHVDDLWHAAVNGRGQYWSATDSSAVADAISAALSNVTRTIGSSSSAATSSLQPVDGRNNQVFVAKYTTKVWTGDLVSYTLDGTTGDIDTSTEVWSAAAELASATPSARRIYYKQPGTTNRRNFNYANLSADSLGSHFANFCTKALVPAQCADFDTDPRTAADNGTNLVNYLRGDGSLSNYSYTKTIAGPPASTSTVSVTAYRTRESILGDIINASPVYVSKPPFNYTDTGYAAYVADHKNRTPVVISAANDGMLHAFAAEAVGSTTPAGTELWAYVPTAVMPEMYRLADTSYESKHHFFVDGTPTVADVHDGTNWKTIIVGGLNSGGRAYYALDITDTTDPKVLWEFTHQHLGLTYGNPVITKRADGTWVVVVSSGYNNNVGGGDGNGRLFVLNALTGQPVADLPEGIPTMVSATAPAGSTGTPSGLSKVNAWIESDKNNTSLRFYAGDLLGNVWRFDTDNRVEPKGKALLLASLKDANGQAQPITIKPETAAVGRYATVLVATGQYLGLSDIANRQVQTVYGIKDALTTTGLGDLTQNRTDFVRQTLTDVAGQNRKISSNAVDWSSKNGWRMDMLSAGERVAIDMQVQYTTLALASAIPGSSVCSPSGGSSWLYVLDLTTGGAVDNGASGSANPANTGLVGRKLGTFLAVGLTAIKRTDGTRQLIIPTSNARTLGSPLDIKTQKSEEPTTPAGIGATRTSWRELLN